MTDSTTAPGESSGLKSNLVAALAYMFGCFSGIILLIVERRDRYVRFHALQSTLAVLLIFVLALILGSLSGIGRFLVAVLSLMSSILWFVLMFKAFTGQRYKLPYVGEFADRQIR